MYLIGNENVTWTYESKIALDTDSEVVSTGFLLSGPFCTISSARGLILHLVVIHTA